MYFFWEFLLSSLIWIRKEGGDCTGQYVEGLSCVVVWQSCSPFFFFFSLIKFHCFLLNTTCLSPIGVWFPPIKFFGLLWSIKYQCRQCSYWHHWCFWGTAYNCTAQPQPEPVDPWAWGSRWAWASAFAWAELWADVCLVLSLLFLTGFSGLASDLTCHLACIWWLSPLPCSGPGTVPCQWGCWPAFFWAHPWWPYLVEAPFFLCLASHAIMYLTIIISD